VQPQINLSSESVNLVLATHATMLCQQIRLLPTKHLRKEIFRGTMLNTDAAEMCFFLIIAKRVGIIHLERSFLTIYLSKTLHSTHCIIGTG
jgi:hypothetical protein